MALNELTPYEISLGDKPFWVVGSPRDRDAYLVEHPEMTPTDLGLIALGIFRLNSYVDYAAIGRVDDVGEEVGWIRAHEVYEWVDWMAGFVYRDPEREAQLKNTERKLGQFLIQFGFAPDVVMETRPSDAEMESYIQHVVDKDEVNGQLIFPEEE